jgi:ferredoxin
VHDSDAGGRADLSDLLGGIDAFASLYCCGPRRWIDGVEELAAGRPLRIERFEAKDLSAPVFDGAFEVSLELSRKTLTVPPDRSILDVVEEAGVFVLSSCREGTCGTCETPVLLGTVDHRDSILTTEEKTENSVMYICVSRASSDRLELEL